MARACGSPCARGVPVQAGPAAGAAWWAVFCALSTVVSLSQPAIGLAFPATLAGLALSANYLVIFFGVS